MVNEALRHQLGSLSVAGLALGTIFFAASLTPTLIPRTYLTQGALAGGSFAVGYATGLLLRVVWSYMELPEPRRSRRTLVAVTGLVCAALAIVFLWRSAEWQNSVRERMGLEPVDSGHPLMVCLIALATFAVILLIARLFVLLARQVTRRTRRYVPRRVATVLGLSAALVLFWAIGNDVVVRTAFGILDSSYSEFDALFEPERPQPTEPERTGSPASLVRWEDLGRAGREFVVSGPSAADIAEATGRPALDPLRVYVGLQSGDTPAQRARLALEELRRQGGFERSLLIVVTPTGTGWVDPAAMDTVEYLHDGDVASVALQYSYLSSPLSLLAEPEYGADAARALFAEIYGYWTTLPRESRPRLYLHGLSLGAMNSERSVELFELIGDPIDGALWSGPPFESRIWRSVTRDRNEGSPAWLPQFRDGSAIRFMNQQGVDGDASDWGPMRIVYLQYASDPIVFFEYASLYRQPEWMREPRGPDVSPELRWFPGVTLLQLALDMAVGTASPMGHGHIYAPEHYVDAWLEVTGGSGMPPDRIEAIRVLLAARLRAQEASDGDAERFEDRGG
jgi:uncharacterized membrane protein